MYRRSRKEQRYAARRFFGRCKLLNLSLDLGKSGAEGQAPDWIAVAESRKHGAHRFTVGVQSLKLKALHGQTRAK